MPNLELALLSYIIKKRPPISLLQSMKSSFKFKSKEIERVYNFLCDSAGIGMNIPDLYSVREITKNTEIIDVVEEAISFNEETATDLESFACLFHNRDKQERSSLLINKITDAIKAGDTDKIIYLADELTTTNRNSFGETGPVDVEDFINLSLIIAKEKFLPTHIPRLNQHLGGYPNGIDYEDIGGFTYGEIAVIGGSTNVGKSTLGTSVWYHLISDSLTKPDCKSVYFNYEGAYDRLRKTFFAMVTGVWPASPNVYGIKEASEEYKRFMEPRKNNFLLYDGVGKKVMPMTVPALEIEISKRAEEGYKAFFIDTINSIGSSNDSKESWHITEQAMRMFEQVAKKYELAIIATAQNKQGLQFDEEKWPEMKWIGQSQYLQQKPGVGIGIYRADLYSGMTLDYTSLAIMKLRHRSPFPKEKVDVTYDLNRRMYIPYTGTQTGIDTASEPVKRKQIYSSLNGGIEKAYATI